MWTEVAEIFRRRRRSTRRPVAGADRRELRRRCVDLVEGLQIPRPFDLSAFCEQLSTQRSRPIHWMTMPLAAGAPSGLLVSTVDAEFVIVEERTSAVHQEHIGVHELAHVLLEHHRSPMSADNAFRGLLPNLDPTMVRQMLGRTHYSEAEEQQAELVASLILGRSSRWSPEETWPVGAPDAPLIRRVERSLRGEDVADPQPAGA